jgi:hypothetical protein
VRLRDEGDRLAQVRGFRLAALDEDDGQFLEAVRRFKPLLVDEGHYRNFQSLADVGSARARLQQLRRMVGVFVTTFPGTSESLRKTFNTATVQFAVSGKFEPRPLKAAEVESYLATGVKIPEVEIPAEIKPFAERWWEDIREELTPLVGKPIDPRFIGSIYVE